MSICNSNWLTPIYEKGLFTIVIPTYNRANTVIETLNSVKAQTYRPFEIIVVDDGSKDHTATIIREWANKHEEPGHLELKYIYQDNAGVGAARNRGIQEMKGEYVQFLDSDDYLHPKRLEILEKTFKETGADFIQTGFEGYNPDTKEMVQTIYGRQDQNQLNLALEGLLFANTLRSSFKRELIEKIGLWDTVMTCFEDREYVERAVAKAIKPIAIREILATARRGGGERISDRLKTYEGRGYRILSEEHLAANTIDRKDISSQSHKIFVNRIYSLGLRSSANGWHDLGKRCLILADNQNISLSLKNKLKRFMLKHSIVLYPLIKFVVQSIWRLPK